ncbi:MAG: spore protease YyaC [Bacillota bacterium]
MHKTELKEVNAGTRRTKINIEDPLAAVKFGWDLASRLNKNGFAPDCPKILLCIGTDRSTGDCLGPLVGSKLSALGQDFFHVYGTLEHPVHASNLKQKLEEIYRCYENPLIIAVDACLGSLENVGCVNIGDGSLQPGAGVNKNLPPVGQIHITGIVNVGGFMEYLVLQNTRLNLVMRMADLIVEGLLNAIGYCTQEEIPEKVAIK